MSAFEESHRIAGEAVRASRAESAKVYPNFQRLQGPFETGFLAGVRWAQDHALQPVTQPSEPSSGVSDPA